MSTQTSFLYPSTAAVLREAGIGIIGHAFTTDNLGRECFVLQLDTLLGGATLTDDVDGVMVLRLDDEEGDSAIASLADSVEEGDEQRLASALDDLLTSATTAFRAGLDVHKDPVAIEVTTDLAVLVAETADLDEPA